MNKFFKLFLITAIANTIFIVILDNLFPFSGLGLLGLILEVFVITIISSLILFYLKKLKWLIYVIIFLNIVFIFFGFPSDEGPNPYMASKDLINSMQISNNCIRIEDCFRSYNALGIKAQKRYEIFFHNSDIYQITYFKGEQKKVYYLIKNNYIFISIFNNEIEYLSGNLKDVYKSDSITFEIKNNMIRNASNKINKGLVIYVNKIEKKERYGFYFLLEKYFNKYEERLKYKNIIENIKINKNIKILKTDIQGN